MTDVARCHETIANYVLDASEAVSHRALASLVGGGSATRAQALSQFCHDNSDTVGAVQVTIAKASSSASTDPRARVIRLSAALKPAAVDADAVVYGVFPAAASVDEDATIQDAMVLAMWAQERKIRNDLFAGRSRHQPLTRELQGFYDSDVQCVEATSRTDMGAARGEDAVSMFDSIKATSTSGRAQPKSSIFKSSSATTTTGASSASASTATAKNSSSSFFKSSTNGTSKPKPASTTTATKNNAPTQTETKRLDAEAMSNVFSIDSDSDEDDDAPKFVKTAPATKSRATKRVMISDDEEEEDDSAKRTSTKRKLSESPERRAKEAKPASPKPTESPKRKRDEVEEVEAEEEPLPTGPIKRRELVTKTRINDDGYMVTEKTYEEVEVSVEELAKERAEAKKKQAAAKAAADAQKARAAAAAAAANNSKSAKSSGPAKQKKLDFFFTRK